MEPSQVRCGEAHLQKDTAAFWPCVGGEERVGNAGEVIVAWEFIADELNEFHFRRYRLDIGPPASRNSVGEKENVGHVPPTRRSMFAQ